MTDELATPFTLSLAGDATVRETADGYLELTSGSRRQLLGVSAPGLRSALGLLAGRGATEHELRQAVAGDSAAPAPELYLSLLELSAAGAVRHSVWEQGAPVMTAEPLSARYHVSSLPLDPAPRYLLSRFACLRREPAGLVLESPLAFARVHLHDGRAASLLAALAAPRRPGELAAQPTYLSRGASLACLGLLHTLRFVMPLDEDGRTEEDSDASLAAWEFHDLLFHTRSRRGRHRNPYGATYRLRDREDPLPAVKAPGAGAVVPLHRPDLEAPGQEENAFTAVLERRRSIRHHAARPLTDRQFGEFLYRAARIRRVIPKGTREPYEASDRVYPSGGAAYPLELYAVVSRCGGLDPGLYHYRPLEHQLQTLSGPTPDTDRLLRSAAYAAAGEIPQVLIVLAARMRRVTWKYSSLAYAVVLKDVGVMYQTMYLVATAMGLAGCALGGGNSDLFANASKLSYFEEPSVGEFILGSPRALER